MRNSPRVYDAQVISADYLISHIDHTFEVWDSRPWSRHYSFDEFCRYVLPYRLADEPLEAWRENYYRKYAARVDSIYSGSDIIRKIQAVETSAKEPSKHSLYALTGSFYNPGPYSGFLAMCLPLALDEWLKGKRVWKHIALAALVLMLLVLPSGMSRTAWLAALVASVYLLAKLYAEHPVVFPKEMLEWAVRMVLGKEAKVESTAIRQMREEVKELGNTH